MKIWRGSPHSVSTCTFHASPLHPDIATSVSTNAAHQSLNNDNHGDTLPTALQAAPPTHYPGEPLSRVTWRWRGLDRFIGEMLNNQQRVGIGNDDREDAFDEGSYDTSSCSVWQIIDPFFLSRTPFGLHIYFPALSTTIPLHLLAQHSSQNLNEQNVKPTI